MKIRFLKSVVTTFERGDTIYRETWPEGGVTSVPNRDGRPLIRAGLAERVQHIVTSTSPIYRRIDSEVDTPQYEETTAEYVELTNGCLPSVDGSALINLPKQSLSFSDVLDTGHLVTGAQMRKNIAALKSDLLTRLDMAPNGDMKVADFVTGDGVVAAAGSLDGVANSVIDSYYGRNSAGQVGFHEMPNRSAFEYATARSTVASQQGQQTFVGAMTEIKMDNYDYTDGGTELVAIDGVLTIPLGWEGVAQLTAGTRHQDDTHGEIHTIIQMRDSFGNVSVIGENQSSPKFGVANIAARAVRVAGGEEFRLLQRPTRQVTTAGVGACWLSLTLTERRVYSA